MRSSKVGDGFKLAVGVAAVVLGIDQLTKWWAVERLGTGPCTPETCIDLVGSLRFRLHYNTGAAFSQGEGFGLILGAIAIVMAIYLLNMARGSGDRVMVVLLGAVAGGALGNVVDRIFRAEDGLLSGGVVDFIDAQFWPIFNVADIAIVCGVIGLLVHQALAAR